MYQITSYGNGLLLTKVLMGTSYILTSGDYGELIQGVVMLAFVVGLIVSHKENIHGNSVSFRLIATVLTAGMVWASFSLPQTTVIVYDPVNNYQTSVKNVPLPLALPMYLENNIGNGVANLYDAWMGTTSFPSSLEYNTTGYNWGTASLKQLGHVTFTNPYDQFTVNSYLTNCYFPSLLMGHANLEDLYSSNNLLQTLQQGANTSNAFLAQIYQSSNPGGTYEDCDTAYNYIVGMVQATTTTGSTAQSFTANLDANSEANQMLLAQVQSNLGPAADFLLNTGLDSQQLIAQTALANSLNPAFQQFSQKYGVSNNNLSFGIAQTMYQQQNTWVQTIFMADMFLPILHNVIEAILFGAFPLIFLMTLIPGFGRKAFAFIVSSMLWLAFWSPMMSIFNGLSTWIMPLHYFAPNILQGNFNLNDMGYIFNKARFVSELIGGMGLTVPFIAYTIASMSSFAGAEMVGSITGAISGGINSSAQSVATEAGAQSMQSQGQQMMQNQANKAYTDPSQFDGMMDYSSQFAATQQQMRADFMKQHGMGGVDKAGVAGMNYQYGQNSAMGSNAERFGELNAKQQMGSLSGLDNYAKSQGLNMEQISSINSETADFLH